MLDGDRALFRKGHRRSPTFLPMSIVAKRSPISVTALSSCLKSHYCMFASAFRPHLSTYAVYCYLPSSVVCRSVCRSVTLVSPAKIAEPIEMPFGLRTWVGQGNHVLDGAQLPMGSGNFKGKGRLTAKYRDALRSSVQKRLNRSR